MANERKAAIDLEAIESTPLKSLSAVDFVTALSGAGAIGIHAMRFWPEKKKYELLTEPENLGNATIGGIFKAGMWVGVIGVVLVIAIVGLVAAKIRQ